MKQVSYTSYDYAPVRAVPVIAAFDSDGHIRPLYVRIEEESLRIHSFYVQDEGHFNMTIFNCKITDHDCLKPLLLTYHRAENVWTIPG